MRRNLSTFIFYSFSFLLLLEWLIPVEQLTETRTGFFIFFLFLSILCAFIGLNQFWKAFISLVFISFCVNTLYYKGQLFHFNWITAFFIRTKADMALLMSGKTAGLSGEFETVICFLLLWLAIQLLEYLIFKRRSIFFFFFLTLVYETVLGTFAGYNANGAIVRTVLIGFAAMGMLTYNRITSSEKSSPALYAWKWMVPLSAMMAVGIIVGLWAPKASSLLNKPLFILNAGETKTEAAGIGGVHTVGYGTDDSALGGPFIGDSRPVFTVEASGSYYWKVETKDTYTGKGWVEEGSNPIQFNRGDFVPVYPIMENVATSKESARITVYSPYRFNHIVYPEGLQKITNIQPAGKGIGFTMDSASQRILFQDSKKQPLLPAQYTIEFAVPSYNASDLMKTTTVDYSQVNYDFIKKYTQLPAKLPQRVKELAQKITAGKNNWFEKAKAIESYFDSPDYTYDQHNVAVPAAEVDYVDQFLFETKKGYCDNFSTSMAVMLRTLGIPARWVKGYTGGEFIKTSPSDSSKQIYQITNNNAHSWVEVYLPNLGWIPFEPTKGYAGDVSINYDAAQQTLVDSSAAHAAVPVKKPQKALQEDPVSSQQAMNGNPQKKAQKAGISAGNNWRVLDFAVILSGMAAAICYWTRRKWLPYFLLAMFRFRKGDRNIESAYHVLLNQLTRYGLKRKKNQTLRSYAGYIDSFFSTREMSQLTAFYEEYLYNRDVPHGSWREMKELWENLIKKTIY